MLFISLSIGYGISQHYEYSDIQKLENTAFLKGKKKGFEEVFETLPKK